MSDSEYVILITASGRFLFWSAAQTNVERPNREAVGGLTESAERLARVETALNTLIEEVKLLRESTRAVGDQAHPARRIDERGYPPSLEASGAGS